LPKRNRRRDGGLHAVLVGDVRLDEQCVASLVLHGLFRGSAGLGVEFDDGDLRALAREDLRGHLGDAGARAGDECDFPLQPAH
jgi:hypothetical protein